MSIRAQLARLGRGTLIYGVGGMINRAVGFLMLPVLTRYLTPADYGVSALVTILSVLLGGLYSLGTGASMGLRYFGEPEGERRARVVWTTAALLAANSAALTAAGFALAPQISRLLVGSPDAAYLVRLSLAALAATTVTAPFLSSLQLEERAKTFVALTAGTGALTVALTVVAVARLGRGVAGLFEAGLAGAVVLLVATVATVAPRLRFGIETGHVWPLVRIGSPSIFGLGAFFFIDWSDRVMIERFAGLGELGVYSIGYSFGMVMSLAVAAFGSAWPPYFVSFLNRRDEAAALFGRVLKYYVIIFGALALCFFVAARPVVLLMTAPAYHGAHTVVGLVALAYMLKGAYLIALPGLVFEKKIHLQTVIEWAAAVVNVGLNLLLVPALRKEGAAVATLAAYCCLPVLAHAAGRRYLRVAYDWKGLAKFGAGFAPLAALSAVASAGAGPLPGLAIGLLSLIVFGFYTFYVPLSRSERAAVLGLISAAKGRLLYASRASAPNG